MIETESSAAHWLHPEIKILSVSLSNRLALLPRELCEQGQSLIWNMEIREFDKITWSV